MAHAFSAVWPTGFPTANVLVMDGSGSEYETGSIFYFDGDNFNKIAQQKGTGIGLLYTLVTKKIGFKNDVVFFLRPGVANCNLLQRFFFASISFPALNDIYDI